ncbi:hypothetical protein [Plantactinospora sp. KBS50]|uniref:hypothetical protein n=1 Tax=Plantactinospora sp. KBS50 TaxID=2024580 RepID=UPI000BAA99F3|nr:hypothetical protein [Plantactinospora sp. KBS50]ASW54856.1 hypothetical protein CIK06_12675 [Plantactinospora sp. KBS50]
MSAGGRAGHAGAAGLWRRVHRYAWACPPPWTAVRRAVAPLGAALPGPLLVLGTGGWSFAVDALGSDRVRALDSLDPWTLAHTRAPASRLAVSSSGATVETRALAEAFPPTRWLCGRQLSPRGADDQVALFGAPLSTAFLAPAALADPAGLRDAYRQLRAGHRGTGLAAAELAAGVTGPDITIAPPAWATEGLRLWLLQLGRQVLCGKSDRFRPHVTLVGPDTRATPGTPAPPAGPDVPATLDLRAARPGLAGLMELMYRAGMFAACLAVRHGVAPAEHRNVTAYKRLLGRRGPAYRTADLAGFVAGWLADRPRLRRLHVVRYGGQPAPLPDPATLGAADRPVEVHRGSAWNHHSFQAVYADPGTAVVVLAATPDGLLRDIAEATRLALGDRAVLVEV